VFWSVRKGWFPGAMAFQGEDVGECVHHLQLAPQSPQRDCLLPGAILAHVLDASALLSPLCTYGGAALLLSRAVASHHWGHAGSTAEIELWRQRKARRK